MTPKPQPPADDAALEKLCSIDGCQKKHIAKGYCSMHYQRIGRNSESMQPEPLIQSYKGKDKSLYQTWLGMKQRCYKKNYYGYKWYGGKGIKVCERWRKSYIAFQNDMSPKPPGTTLDRIDSNGDYEPSNCRWATPREQSLNREIYSKSNHRGVNYSNKDKQWMAQISFYNRKVSLGRYNSLDDAIKARQYAEEICGIADEVIRLQKEQQC